MYNLHKIQEILILLDSLFQNQLLNISLHLKITIKFTQKWDIEET
jgi:hypothetical protein